VGGEPVIAPETTLEGTLVRLRPLADADIESLVRWYTDPDVLHWLHRSEDPAAEAETERARVASAANDPAEVTWIMETTAGRAIGYVRIGGIDAVHQRAWLAISIGEKDCWSADYGTDAVRLVLRYGFERLALRRYRATRLP